MANGKTGRIAAAALAVFLIRTLPALSAEEGKGAGAREKRNSCVECHRSLEGDMKTPVLEWERSVHAGQAAACDLCHGGNPEIFDAKRSKGREFKFAGKPRQRDIPVFCGRPDCHGTAFTQFTRSPHYGSTLRTGEPGCVSCHGAHNVQRSSMNILTEKTCTRCHPVEYSKEIISAVFGIEKDLGAIERNMDYLQAKNAEVPGSRERLSRTKQLYHQIVHVFSTEDIRFNKKIVELEVVALKDDIAGKMSVMRRMDYIYIFTVAFSIAVLIGVAAYLAVMFVRRGGKA